MTLPDSNEIEGVIFKPIKSFSDQRGFFREIIRLSDPFFDTDGFKQLSHSRMTKDVVKAWHYHHLQTDWWYMTMGCATAVLIDHRENSSTYKKKLQFKMGEEEQGGQAVCVKIPPGVLHGCRVHSEEAHLFYVTSREYNPEDEGRIPYNCNTIDHDWGDGAITSENDRKSFTPVAPKSWAP